jgi:hypothetical protein
MSATYSAGGECDAWCTKCKRDSLHNIIAVDPSTKLPARVECRSCKGAHRYTAPKSGPKPSRAGTTSRADSPRRSASTPKPAAPATSRVIEQRWDEWVARTAGADERPYNVKTQFEPGDAIRHSQFGLGFVVEALHENRIKVLFRDAERTLVTGLSR